MKKIIDKYIKDEEIRKDEEEKQEYIRNEYEIESVKDNPINKARSYLLSKQI